MGAELTLGAEEELHLIDLDRWELSARAPQILSRLAQRLLRSRNPADHGRNKYGGRPLPDRPPRGAAAPAHGVIEVAAKEGLGVAAVGTAPRSTYADFELTSTGRYSRMQEQYRLLVDEQLICGTQIHVGVADRDLAVEIGQRIARDLPVLLALSASSPYWNGQDTGYASIRTIIWQRWPTAGSPGPLASAAEYDELVADLISSGVIADAKMAYFDVRPSSHAPTLELRVCDACPLVDDAVLIAGLFRGMVRAAELDIEAGRPYAAPRAPLHRAGDLAGGAQRPVPAARRRHRPPATAARRRRRPRPGRPAPSAAGGVRRLGDRHRAHRDGAGPRQLRRPAARRLRRAGQARGRHAARRRGDPRRRGPDRRGAAPPSAATGPGPATRPSGPDPCPRPAYRGIVATLQRAGPCGARRARDAPATTWVAAAGPDLRRRRRGAAVRRRPGPPHPRTRTSGRSWRPA